MVVLSRAKNVYLQIAATEHVPEHVLRDLSGKITASIHLAR
jgi:hypothetical protein